MSSVILDTKKEIFNFFKILAEESVKEAKSDLEQSPTARRLEKMRKEDKGAYSDIKEAEDDIDANVEVEENPGSEDRPERKEFRTPEQDDIDIEEVSLDSIAEKIKIMRSGRSVDDSSVKDQSRVYFDILSEPERRALYIFLDALAGIMTGAVDGQHAPDPSDHNVSISRKREEQEVSQDQEVELKSKVKLDSEEEESEEEESEDTSPPIQVGKPQDLSEIRKKVIKLLGKN
jgi:hypothetical protein